LSKYIAVSEAFLNCYGCVYGYKINYIQALFSAYTLIGLHTFTLLVEINYYLLILISSKPIRCYFYSVKHPKSPLKSYLCDLFAIIRPQSNSSMKLILGSNMLQV